MTNYSNPRMFAVIENWPSGARRVTARFHIEVSNTIDKRERAVRVTTGQPVKLTYSRRQRIVDGDDGRTYIAKDHGAGMIIVTHGDMKFQKEIAHFPSERHAELMKLFEPSKPIASPDPQEDEVIIVAPVVGSNYRTD